MYLVETEQKKPYRKNRQTFYHLVLDRNKKNVLIIHFLHLAVGWKGGSGGTKCCQPITVIETTINYSPGTVIKLNSTEELVVGKFLFFAFIVPLRQFFFWKKRFF